MTIQKLDVRILLQNVPGSACTQGNYIIGKAPAFDEAIEDQIQTQDDKHYPKKTQSLPLASYQLDLQKSSEKLSW